MALYSIHYNKAKYKCLLNVFSELIYKSQLFSLRISCQETQKLVAEPVPGIAANPDEHNARYFHVVISGPKDVSCIQPVSYLRVVPFVLYFYLLTANTHIYQSVI